MGKYDDILNIPFHFSESQHHISRNERAAQFQPFAALTDFNEEVSEEDRRFEQKSELDEQEKERINRILTKIASEMDKNPFVFVIYWKPDINGNSGIYTGIRDFAKKIDAENQRLVLKGGADIPFDDITEIHTITF